MTEKRYATRYLLPLEMCVALQLLAMAVAGSWNGSALWTTLLLSGDNLTWTLVIGAIGSAALGVAAWEWLCGREWVNGRLRMVLIARKWLSLLTLLVWSYAVFVMWTAPAGWRMVEVMLAAVPMAAFAAWSWWVNYRTECVLDPTLKTTTLERNLETRRPCW